MKEMKTLERLLANGKITRRDFIVRISALGLTATVSPSLFTGSAQAATPKKGEFKLLSE